MDRKAIARQTLEIIEDREYQIGSQVVDIRRAQEQSVEKSVMFTPEQGERLLQKHAGTEYKKKMTHEDLARTVTEITVTNCATVEALLAMKNDKKENIGILNFASAKNPGGGFINGAMAQEESLAASGGLYETLLAHEEYYQVNRANPSMMYTDYAIYSPEVVFFRDEKWELLPEYQTASVLTLPAVNMGQVIIKGEDVHVAEQVMRRRMKLALAIFYEMGAKNLILGAYGCGVFRNDPVKIASWWSELLAQEFAGCFESVCFAVLDRSKNPKCFAAFKDSLKLLLS